MPLYLKQGNIASFPADAVVNAANPTLLGGGGVDGAIHAAAGPELFEECLSLGGCETGHAKMTKGYRMPCKYIIHTVGPVWEGGGRGEEELLASCYSESLRLAEEAGCETVAFPLISSGAYGYPPRDAWKVAKDAILGYLLSSESDLTVSMVVLDKRMLDTDESDSDRLLANRVRDMEKPKKESLPGFLMADKKVSSRVKKAKDINAANMAIAGSESSFGFMCLAEKVETDLDERLRSKDESFSEMVLRKIDESGMTDVECYKRANIDRKLFSKIRNRDYRPSKPTAVALAFALRLPKTEAEDLLRKAGYALSQNLKFDVIVGYFLDQGRYDLFAVNDILFKYDQPQLGG